MTRYESGCVNCGLPCWGKACPNYRVKTMICDTCKDEAEYTIEGEDFCKSCAKQYLLQVIKDNYSVEELCEILDMEYEVNN